jgi:hypothetical protein
MNYGETYTQSITMFDDVDDDEYDGDIGENDDEVPYIKLQLTLTTFKYTERAISPRNRKKSV